MSWLRKFSLLLAEANMDSNEYVYLFSDVKMRASNNFKNNLTKVFEQFLNSLIMIIGKMIKLQTKWT